MFTRGTGLEATAALACGCAEQPSETQEIIENLVQAGFPAGDIMVVNGVVHAGRDAEVSLAASREMLHAMRTLGASKLLFLLLMRLRARPMIRDLHGEGCGSQRC